MNYHSFKFQLPELMPIPIYHTCSGRNAGWFFPVPGRRSEMRWHIQPFNFLLLDYLENKREWDIPLITYFGK